MKRILPLMLLAIALAFSAGARRIADFFVQAPMYRAAPYIDPNMRMDMLDYFRSNLPPKTTNIFGEPTAVLSEDDRLLSVKAGEGVRLDYGLAVRGTDSLLVVIETLPIPMPDSKVSFYTTDWEAASPSEPAPTLSDWLTDEGRSMRVRAEEILPFIAAEAKLAENGSRIIFTPTIYDYFGQGDSIVREAERYIKPQLIYDFNGKTFK